MINQQVLVRSEHAIQVSLHQVTHQEKIANDSALAWHIDHILQGDDVVVLTVFHDDDLAKYSFSVNLKNKFVFKKQESRHLPHLLCESISLLLLMF